MAASALGRFLEAGWAGTRFYGNMTSKTKSTDLPVPETRSAILATAFHPKGPPVFTPHIYVATRACELPLGDGAAYEFIFRCLVHGTERRWGNVEIAAQEVN